MAAPVLGPVAEFTIDVALFAILIPVVVRHRVSSESRMKREAAAAQEAALAEDRRMLARELHDSIAQHLSYLHLRLDELAQKDNGVGASAVATELGRLREVANEAYEEVYCLMSSLRSGPVGQLADTLRARATLSAHQAGFDTRIIQVGEPQRLKSCYEQEITLIVREALANVEKHAPRRT